METDAATSSPPAARSRSALADGGRVVLLAVALEIAMIALAVLWVAVYSHAIAPGLAAADYEAYAQRASPVVAILAGPVVFWLAGRIGARRGGGRGARIALVATLVCVTLDTSIALGAPGMSAPAWTLVGVAGVTKVLAAWLGGRRGRAGA